MQLAICISSKEAVNPELAKEIVNGDELFKVILGSYDNDTKTTNFPSSETPLGCGGTETLLKFLQVSSSQFLYKTNLSDVYL